jgi:hypothetical protein
MSQKCFITGCIKNCSNYLDNVFENIKKIGSIFNEYIIIVSYDISNDNSLDILIEKQKYFNNMIIIINENPLEILRVHNISNARNKILDKIRELNKPEFEYFIMLDFDDVSSGDININTIEKYLNTDWDWDALSFNRNPYYDIWALSYSPYIYSCWHWDNHNIVEIIKNDIINKLNNINKNELFECYSAFNGLSIYKISKFINCSYDWDIINTIKYIPDDILLNNINVNKEKNINIIYNNNGFGDCEHRKFHLEAIQKNNAKIFISPLFLFN